MAFSFEKTAATAASVLIALAAARPAVTSCAAVLLSSRLKRTPIGSSIPSPTEKRFGSELFKMGLARTQT